MRELVSKHFIPAADEVDRLQRGNDFAGKFFRGIAQRSFARLRTTQGTYIVTPAGVLIDFGNVIAPDKIKSFLENGVKNSRTCQEASSLENSEKATSQSQAIPATV